jgi:hypothetical protein
MDRLKPFFKTRYRFCQQGGAAFRLVQRFFYYLNIVQDFYVQVNYYPTDVVARQESGLYFFHCYSSSFFDDHEEIHEKNKKLWTI